jgi:hypothetical protein
MSQEQVWEQTANALLGAAIELGYDVDKIATRAKEIMLGNEVYRFVGHAEMEVMLTVKAIDEVTESIKQTHANKPG